LKGTTLQYRTEKRGNVIHVWFDDVASAWEQWFLFRSDAHHDSVHCRRDLELKHLKQARERNAIILDGGDLFDAMQGRFDPRRSYKDVRPEYLIDDKYYDNIVNDTVQFLNPYADLFLLFGRGNHESSVIKNASTDLTDRLVHLLNMNGGRAYSGGYGGYVRLYFSRGSGAKSSCNIKYFHGAGGDAPVTKGMIQTNRQAVYLADADIVWNGHNHNEYITNNKRERLSNKGVLYFDLMTFLRTPGYKDDYGDGSDGWEVERGSVPKPHGAIWGRFYQHNGKIKREFIADIE
jgi:hypothetical protein